MSNLRRLVVASLGILVLSLSACGPSVVEGAAPSEEAAGEATQDEAPAEDPAEGVSTGASEGGSPSASEERSGEKSCEDVGVECDDYGNVLGDDEAAITTGSGTSFTESEFSCRDLDTTYLWPQHTDPHAVEYGSSSGGTNGASVSMGDMSSCELSLDTNFDGIVNPGDMISGADSVWLSAGYPLSYYEEEGSYENAVDAWGTVCLEGETEFRERPGWDAVSACVRDGLTVEITFLALGERYDQTEVGFTCSILTYGMPIDDRLDELEVMCTQALDALSIQ